MRHDITLIPPADTALLRRSFDAAMRAPERFGDGFYARLFELAPQVRPLFPADLKAQRQKLLQALTVLVRGLDQPQAMVPMLRLLGARHVGYGAQPAHFAAVGEALIDALDRFGETPLDGASRDAWTRLYGWIAATMIDGAASADAATAPDRAATA
jgi:hemoglobin-like flavoprotein